MDQLNINIFPKFSIMQLFFGILGIFFYISLIFLFSCYYRCLSFIKEKIFTFILLNSLTLSISIFIESATKKFIFVYISNTIQFTLILCFLDNCFRSHFLSKDVNDLEINYKLYIILIFMLCSLPLSKYLSVSDKNIFDQNTIKLILSILFYEQIREKIQNLIDYLKEKKINASDSDIPYNIAYYYYKSFLMINSIFYASFIFFIIYFILIILDNFVNYKITIQYVSFFMNLLGIYLLIIGCILFFYSSNRNKIEKHRKENKKIDNSEESQSFRVIDVNVTPEDVDENVVPSVEIKKKNKRKKNFN